jgi:hypothetical protein
MHRYCLLEFEMNIRNLDENSFSLIHTIFSNVFSFIHLFIELSSVQKTVSAQHRVLADNSSNIIIFNGATLLLHRLYSYNHKPNLPFLIPTYILLMLLYHVHPALYRYFPVFLILCTSWSSKISIQYIKHLHPLCRV